MWDKRYTLEDEIAQFFDQSPTTLQASKEVVLIRGSTCFYELTRTKLIIYRLLTIAQTREKERSVTRQKGVR
jgi:hypothetical protein